MRHVSGPASLAGQRATAVALGAILATVLVIGLHGATSIRPEEGFDGAAHVAYADVLEREGRLPSEEESYEFHSPPAFHWVALQAQRAVDGIAEPARSLAGGTFDPRARVAWLLVAALVGLLFFVSRPRAPLHRPSLVLGAGAAIWLLGALVATAGATRWSGGQLLSVLAMCAFLLASWLLAREVWPRGQLLPLLAVLATAVVPIVLRLGTMFHPEMLFAFLAVAATVIFLRGRTAGWPIGHGAALGALLGLAALTRQTAAVVIVGLAIASFVLGRGAALRFAAATAAILLLVAGPWWLYQADRYGNPIQSNLNREGYLLEGGQPRSFYISLPLRDLVVHPYRPAFQNELLPQFHADLWSDWFGGQHGFWGEASSAARFFASTQSVLGAFAALATLAGVVMLAVPALVAGVRRRQLDTRGAAFLTFLVLAALTWVAFLITLLRFPQAEGDPIKSSYMLYLTPGFAIVTVAFAERLWWKGRRWRVPVIAWSGLYALSYAGFLATSW